MISQISSYCQNSYHHIENIEESMQKSLENSWDRVENDLFELRGSLCEKTRRISENIEQFINKNKQTLIFASCLLVTAVCAPNLFFPFAIGTIIVRVELNTRLRKLAQKLKDEENPYLKQKNYGPNYVTSTECALGVIGAIDAIALATIYSSGSIAVLLLPALGGIAAGSCLAKFGMDLAHHRGIH